MFFSALRFVSMFWRVSVLRKGGISEIIGEDKNKNGEEECLTILFPHFLYNGVTLLHAFSRHFLIDLLNQSLENCTRT